MSGACYVCGGVEWITRVGSLRDAPSVGVVECRDCGLVVPAEVPPVVVDYATGTMYGDAPIDFVGWRDTGAADNQRRAAEVRALLHAGDSVLDVGCGSGGFIHELKRGGVNAFGIELDQAASEFLASECQRSSKSRPFSAMNCVPRCGDHCALGTAPSLVDRLTCP